MTKPIRTTKKKTVTEKRWAELTEYHTGGRVFPNAVSSISEPGESKAAFVDRECSEPEWVVRVQISYEVPV